MLFCSLKVMPDWERLTAHIEADAETKEKLGWVREVRGHHYGNSSGVARQTGMRALMDFCLYGQVAAFAIPPSKCG